MNAVGGKDVSALALFLVFLSLIVRGGVARYPLGKAPTLASPIVATQAVYQYKTYVKAQVVSKVADHATEISVPATILLNVSSDIQSRS